VAELGVLCVYLFYLPSKRGAYIVSPVGHDPFESRPTLSYRGHIQPSEIYITIHDSDKLAIRK
jgi:hypothetical protein